MRKDPRPDEKQNRNTHQPSHKAESGARSQKHLDLGIFAKNDLAHLHFS
jgi:hypothetical protein